MSKSVVIRMAVATAAVWAALAGTALAVIQPPDTQITVTRTGLQLATVVDSDGQINCGADCSGSYAANCEIDGTHGCNVWSRGFTTLETTPPAGFGVVWSGATCGEASQTQNTCTVDQSGTVEAHFDDTSPPSVALGSPGSDAKLRGTISLSGTAGDAQTGIKSAKFVVGGQNVVASSEVPGQYHATYDTSQLANGPAQITLSATNQDDDIAQSTVSVTIDNTAPSLSVSAGPPSGSTFGLHSTQTWQFSASDATTGPPDVQCSVGPHGSAPSFGACSGSGTESVSDEPDGAYTFSLRATDGAGNVTTLTRDFSIDGTPADTLIDSGPANGSSSHDTTATFAFHATQVGSTFRCRVYPAALTPGAFGACSGSATHTASGFAPGTYTFEVVSTDPYGNIDPTPAKRTFTVTAATTGGAGGTGGVTTTTTTTTVRAIVNATLVSDYAAFPKFTRYKRLVLRNVPAGAKVSVSCKGKKCPAKRTTKLSKFAKKKLRVGTKLTIRVTKPSAIGKQFVIKIRAGKRPSVKISQIL